MRVTFTCQTCSSPVEYDFAGVETHRLRRYGVPHYVRASACPTCAAPGPSSASLVFETADESRHVPAHVPPVGEALLV